MSFFKSLFSCSVQPSETSFFFLTSAIHTTHLTVLLNKFISIHWFQSLCEHSQSVFASLSLTKKVNMQTGKQVSSLKIWLLLLQFYNLKLFKCSRDSITYFCQYHSKLSSDSNKMKKISKHSISHSLVCFFILFQLHGISSINQRKRLSWIWK